MISMRNRIRQAGITSAWTIGETPPGMMPGTTSFVVTLTNADGRTLVTPFHMGPALCREPDTAEVLSCLASDAAGVEDARGGFEDWAAEYGYDPDSRNAERIYRECVKARDELREFLGDDYDAFLYQTEPA